MIIVLTSCSYFRNGFRILANEWVKKEHIPSNQFIFASHIQSVDSRTLRDAKAVVVDYTQQDIPHLIALLELKQCGFQNEITLITREERFENTMENILINTLSNFTIDCASAIRKLTDFLRNIEFGKLPVVITKGMRWHRIEQEINLTRKESELLPYIICGKNNKEISRFLDLSGKAISHHRRNIYDKFSVNNLTELYNSFN
ncbi:helix-turn-helix transcriptional regulator [Salmonella enterica]|nr:helix-turn-helix transcriptional regulator [Salmonella enterica]EIE0789396.1 helix-turn-helix transcriptional regulator [Salmonella enterica]EJI4782588.1 helix-turn-helix transcriptional regulator [Salmonella enterica]